jgi:hypothetical protein
MTPDDIRSTVDGWAARAQQCQANGEREAAAVYAECTKTLARYLPAKAPEPAPKAVKPVKASTEPVEVPKGVFSGIAAKLKG